MKTKTFLIASTLITSGLLASCDLADEPKKLNPDQICDAICKLNLKEQKELQSKVDQKYEDHLKTGAKISSD
ncbi:Lipoprotein [Candidatus Liberibacter solanacearum]|uniref:SEC-dependent effector SDE5640 n=1 Tax=Candidatus Liberibacter solanacearum TaxID=556287 RepID=UPI00387111A4